MSVSHYHCKCLQLAMRAFTNIGHKTYAHIYICCILFCAAAHIDYMCHFLLTTSEPCVNGTVTADGLLNIIDTLYQLRCLHNVAHPL